MTKEFPIWEPLNKAKYKMNSRSNPNAEKDFYKVLRTTSTSFVGRQDVREFIFGRDGYRCTSCGSEENLQIDHVISVYACSRGKIPVEQLNSELNLKTICKRCNCSKAP